MTADGAWSRGGRDLGAGEFGEAVKELRWEAEAPDRRRQMLQPPLLEVAEQAEAPDEKEEISFFMSTEPHAGQSTCDVTPLSSFSNR